VDQSRMAELMVRLEHRHSDGTWETLEPRAHHDPADHDPEKGWGDGEVYVCPSCDEQVRVRRPDEPSGRA
jgi:hypothetical protein